MRIEAESQIYGDQQIRENEDRGVNRFAAGFLLEESTQGRKPGPYFLDHNFAGVRVIPLRS